VAFLEISLRIFTQIILAMLTGSNSNY